jgi:hypothetical protein
MHAAHVVQGAGLRVGEINSTASELVGINADVATLSVTSARGNRMKSARG